MVLLGLTGMLALAWLISPIEPVVWKPPALAPLAGPSAPNDRLTPIEWWAKDVIGPEAITIAPDGRLLKYVPSTKELTRVAEGFNFANGVALAGDESFLVVSETGTYQLWRIWLAGPKAGRKELFTDALPGFPDNVRWSPSRNGFWVAIGSPRKLDVDLLADWPNVRRIVAGLPKWVQPKAARHSYVLLVDLEGKPVESFQHDAPDSYSPIACATEHEGFLYLGSFEREGVARFKLP